MNNRNWRGLFAWVIFFGIILFIYQSMRSVNVEREISYSEFKRRLHEGQVVMVKVRPDLITGRFHSPDGKDENFRSTPLNDPGLVDDLEHNHVKEYSGEVDKSWFSMVLMNFGPALVFLFFWFLMIRQMQGGGK